MKTAHAPDLDRTMDYRQDHWAVGRWQFRWRATLGVAQRAQSRPRYHRVWCAGYGRVAGQGIKGARRPTPAPDADLAALPPLLYASRGTRRWYRDGLGWDGTVSGLDDSIWTTQGGPFSTDALVSELEARGRPLGHTKGPAETVLGPTMIFATARTIPWGCTGPIGSHIPPRQSARQVSAPVTRSRLEINNPNRLLRRGAYLIAATFETPQDSGLSMPDGFTPRTAKSKRRLFRGEGTFFMCFQTPNIRAGSFEFVASRTWINAGTRFPTAGGHGGRKPVEHRPEKNKQGG